MGIKARFTDHPASVGETYGEHFKVATHFAAECAKASFSAAVHAVYPCVFTHTASDKVKCLHAEMTAGARGEVAECDDVVQAQTAPAVGRAASATG